ncbi:protein-glutamate O-methyltransferase CheR [Azospirillum sp.]|uniref:CheR family methyltransferase n=1 Tax=Azospirillum sp. TaxID=34012 RepID=UPI002D291C57|nr:protein-glutamate O-methyltransferase CheR [Azospirillum sp.]HYD65016.1 protein-glutamate O-methyltransferase CheR [Azospirillum sp.]
MKTADIEAIEVELFVDALRRRHGYDFGDYARASLKRRIAGIAADLGCARIADTIPLILHEEGVLPRILGKLSVPVSEMFRDPPMFRSLRTQVVPMLQSYDRINVWQAGCAYGEEVYSLAILLEEEGLYDRVQIYATDINDQALARAEEGVFPLTSMRGFADNYLKSGGRRSLTEYVHARYGFAKVDDRLKRNISFAHHNLTADGVFCEVNLLLCRNVLIYFNRALQNRVLHLFHDSLARNGVLCLGRKETLAFSDLAGRYETLDAAQKIYRKVPALDDVAVPTVR